ncbi:unnamed protein product, partial [Amoebophrya sp. A25]
LLSSRVEPENGEDEALLTVDENRNLIDRVVGELGFEREDVTAGVAALRSGGGFSPSSSEQDRFSLLQQWLALNVPEDALPDKFQIKGQFRGTTNSGVPGGSMSSSSSSSSFNPATSSSPSTRACGIDPAQSSQATGG